MVTKGNVIEFFTQSLGITGGIVSNVEPERCIGVVNHITRVGEADVAVVYTPDQTRVMLPIGHVEMNVLAESTFAGWGSL